MKVKRPDIVVVGLDAAFANFGMVKATIDPVTLKITNMLALKLVKTEALPSEDLRKSGGRIRRGRELLQEMRAFCYGAQIAIAEVPDFSQSASAAWGLGIAVGILCACPLPLVEVTPREVKVKSVGKATATKDEMRKWAYNAFPNAPWLTHNGKRVNDNEHLADALAAIQAGTSKELFKGYAGLFTSKELLAMPMNGPSLYEIDAAKAEAAKPERRRLRK